MAEAGQGFAEGKVEVAGIGAVICQAADGMQQVSSPLVCGAACARYQRCQARAGIEPIVCLRNAAQQIARLHNAGGARRSGMVREGDYLEAMRVESNHNKWQKLSHLTAKEVNALLSGEAGTICRLRIRRVCPVGIATTFDCALERLVMAPPSASAGPGGWSPHPTAIADDTSLSSQPLQRIRVRNRSEGGTEASGAEERRLTASNVNERICAAMARVNSAAGGWLTSGAGRSGGRRNGTGHEVLEAKLGAPAAGLTATREGSRAAPVSAEDRAFARGRPVTVCEDDNATGWGMWWRFFCARLAVRWNLHAPALGGVDSRKGRVKDAGWWWRLVRFLLVGTAGDVEEAPGAQWCTREHDESLHYCSDDERKED